MTKGAEGRVPEFIDLPAEEARAEELSIAFTEAPVGMALLDESGRFLQVNRALCDMTGFRRSELVGRAVDELFDPDDVHLDVIQRQLLLSDQVDSYRVEKRCRHRQGHLLWVAVSVTAVRLPDGSPRYLVITAEDISQRKRDEERLQHLANRDPLTGLLNRRRFEDELARQITLRERYGESIAVLVIDLDHFKPINDRYGHDAGDRVLCEVAAAINERLRTTDLAARLGGDEFVVLIPHGDAAHIPVVAQALVDAIGGRAIRDGGTALRVTASIGVAVLEGDSAAGAAEVLAWADAAMYEAKRSGGNRWSAAAVPPAAP